MDLTQLVEPRNLPLHDMSRLTAQQYAYLTPSPRDLPVNTTEYAL